MQAKIQGRELTKAPVAAEPTNVVDLMEALRASVAAADSGKAKRVSATIPDAPKAKKAAKKTAKKSAKKTPAKKAAKKTPPRKRPRRPPQTSSA